MQWPDSYRSITCLLEHHYQYRQYSKFGSPADRPIVLSRTRLSPASLYCRYCHHEPYASHGLVDATMKRIPIFAGLGSDVLFDDSTRDQALRDSRLPRCTVLLEACHHVFLDEVSRALSEHGQSVAIDLDDFQKPRNLIEPCHRYRGNPTVQNATLFVVQSLRYQALVEERGENSHIATTVAVGGFCVGLLTAVAVATSADGLQFLSRAEQCFRAAVLIGLASHHMRMKISSSPSGLPWSIIVAGIGNEEMLSVLSTYESQVHTSMDSLIFGLLCSIPLTVHRSSNYPFSSVRSIPPLVSRSRGRVVLCNVS